MTTTEGAWQAFLAAVAEAQTLRATTGDRLSSASPVSGGFAGCGDFQSSDNPGKQ